MCACQEHKPRLLTAGNHSTPAAVSPGTGEAWRGPQPELPGAVPVLPHATARCCPGTCARERSSPASPRQRRPRYPAAGRPGRTRPRAGATVPGVGKVDGRNQRCKGFGNACLSPLIGVGTEEPTGSAGPASRRARLMRAQFRVTGALLLQPCRMLLCYRALHCPRGSYDRLEETGNLRATQPPQEGGRPRMPVLPSTCRLVCRLRHAGLPEESGPGASPRHRTGVPP